MSYVEMYFDAVQWIMVAAAFALFWCVVDHLTDHRE